MKKLFIIATLLTSIQVSSNAQYFKGTFSLENNDTISFKIQANDADITSEVSYMEFCIRFLTAQAPTLTSTAIINNNTIFGSSLKIDSFPSHYTEGNYTYMRFVHNTGILSSRTYNNTSEYEVFKLKLSETPTAAMGIELVSDLATTNHVFGVVKGEGIFIDPTTNDQLYGAGMYTSSTGFYVPLIMSPLATKFIQFTATSLNNNALLNWTVANENSNVKMYEVERSTNNGLNFTKIFTVAAKNNGNASNTYSSTDANIKSLRTNGNIQYRIKELDKDGRFVYSENRTIKKEILITVYPNPTIKTATVSFELVSAQPVFMSVRDASGKTVSKIKIDGTPGVNNASIDLSRYARGNYILYIDANQEIKTFSLIKQ